MYNKFDNKFDAYVNRKGTACIKWDMQEKNFGKNGLLPFWVADSDYKTYNKVTEALMKRVQTGIFGYTAPDDEYLKSVQGWIKRRHNWEIKPEWIVPTDGIVVGLYNAVDSLTEPGDKIVVQSPVYYPFYKVVENTGRIVAENKLKVDENGIYRMDFEDLENKLKDGAKMIILCSPHNPVTRVWTEKEIREVASLCRKYGTIIVSDEIHWDLMLFGHKHFTFGRIDEIKDQLVVCTAASKTFNIAGLEASNLIIPNEELRTKFNDYVENKCIFYPNALGLEATKAAYKDGDKWVDDQLVFLSENAQTVVEFFKEHLPEVKVTPPEGTYLLWLDMRAYGLTSKELVEKIVESGAALNNGHDFGKDYDGFVRMNIACPRVQLREGLMCIYNALSQVKLNSKKTK